MSTILIENGVVIPMDGQNRSLAGQAVLVDGDRIAAIGDPDTLRADNALDRVIDASGKAVMPGFVNAHTHMNLQSIMRGVIEDKEGVLPFWFTARERLLSSEQAEIFATAACVDQLRAGYTTFSDLDTHQDEVARAAQKTGNRAVLGPTVNDISWADAFQTGNREPDPVLKARELETALAAYDAWHGAESGRIECHFATELLGGTFPATMGELKRIADERGVGFKLNANIMLDLEGAIARSVGSDTPIEALDAHGVLDERTNLVHNFYASESDLEILARTGAYMIHCGHAQAKHGVVATLLASMHQCGMNVVLGSDSMANDPFEQMRSALLLARVNMKQASEAHDYAYAVLGDAYYFFELATIKAAHACCLGDRVGSLEVGKQADIILVDYQHPAILPITDRHDLLTNLHYYGSGRDVHTVLVAGEVVVEDRKVLTVDERSLFEELEGHAAAFWRDVENAGLGLVAA